MGLYDGIKDVAKIVQQADNLDLYRQLLDLQAQALDLQTEVAKLREENAELKKARDLGADIEFYVDPYITRKSDEKPIKYCASCWVDKKKLVPIQNLGGNDYICPLCRVRIFRENWE